eukprot:5682395-Amphidinium_carterae.2
MAYGARLQRRSLNVEATNLSGLVGQKCLACSKAMPAKHGSNLKTVLVSGILVIAQPVTSPHVQMISETDIVQEYVPEKRNNQSDNGHGTHGYDYVYPYMPTPPYSPTKH